MGNENKNSSSVTIEPPRPAPQASVSWDDVVAATVGHTYVDKFDDGVRFIILRGPAALCAYLGVPSNHPLAGYDYDNVPVECHGGLTYSNEGDGTYLPKGFFWYGWDYGHAGDASIYDRLARIDRDVKWLPTDVENDSWNAVYGFRHLMRLAEQITAKAKTT